MQWQHPTKGRERKPDPGEPMRGGKSGTDPIANSWRFAKGWKLKVVEYYSKSFDQAQRASHA